MKHIAQIAYLFAVIDPSAWKMNSKESNFVMTEFSEVRPKTNSQKFWAPHRHTKDRGPYTTGPPPRKGRLALREEAAPL
jgi:hypothetical protein